jgi:hypothetical protein
MEKQKLYFPSIFQMLNKNYNNDQILKSNELGETDSNILE